MPNNASIMQIVQTVKSEATKAIKNFKQGKNSIESRANVPINLFGGSAVSTVASIATDTHRISDELYSTLQPLVSYVNSRCTALLDDNVKLSTIKEVCDLLKWLNDESVIKISFTAAVNLGMRNDIADIRYEPSIENKMIQKEWENRYKLSPKYAEEQKRLAEEKKRLTEIAEKEKEAVIQAKSNRDRNIAEAKAKYEKSENAYSAMVSDAERKKKAFEEKIQKYIEDFLKKHTADLKAEKGHITEKLHTAQEQRSALGFFSFSEKKRLKELLLRYENDLLKLNDTTEFDKELQRINNIADNARKEYEAALNKKIDTAFSKKNITVKSETPRNTSAYSSAKLSDQAEEVLSFVGNWWSTVPEIGELLDFSSSKLTACLHKLVKEGFVIRNEVSGRAYFALAGTPYEDIVEVREQAVSDKELTLPNPPDLIALFKK